MRNVDAAASSLSTVLNLVRTGHATTRLEIERVSELGRAAVTDRLGTLASLNLIDESELGTASGGRAPRLVRFNRDIARILVATLDQTALGVAIADVSGTLLLEHHEALDLNAPPKATWKRLETMFDWMLEKNAKGYPIWGIGVSVPGPVQTETSNSYLAASPAILPGWEEAHFVESMIRHFQAPVWLRNNVETMAMGEVPSDDAAGNRTMLFVKIGRRIGASLVVNGRLFRGAQGSTGLIGQLPVQSDGRTAPLELLAGSDTIARDGLEAASCGKSPYLSDLLSKNGEVTAIDVGQAAQAGDTAAMEVMSRSGRLIGHVVATLTNMLNPSLIVLSGSIAQTNDILLAAVREVVYGESHPLVTRDLHIRSSRLGSSAGLVGAAAVVIEDLFEPPRLKSWISLGAPTAAPEFKTLLAKVEDSIARNGRPDVSGLSQRRSPTEAHSPLSKTSHAGDDKR